MTIKNINFSSISSSLSRGHGKTIENGGVRNKNCLRITALFCWLTYPTLETTDIKSNQKVDFFLEKNSIFIFINYFYRRW